jgi:hypothetical protein
MNCEPMIRREEYQFPTAGMIETMSLLQWPLLAGAFWWNVAAAWCWVHPPAHRHAHFHPDHEQLPVPDEIEETGEHALFA